MKFFITGHFCGSPELDELEVVWNEKENNKKCQKILQAQIQKKLQ